MSGGPDRPVAVLAMFAGLEPHALGDDDRVRLERVVDLVDPVALDSFTTERARDLLARAEVLLTHWGCPQLDAAALDATPRLRLVAHAAGTVKGIVTPEVFARGISVTSAAAANAIPVAEFTLAAILWANKDVWGARDRSRGGAPTLSSLARAGRLGNVDKRIGIVGASLVGRALITLLEPFELEVAVYDPYLDAEGADRLGVVRVDDLTELCATSDVVSIHAPELASTRHMIGAQQLAALRDGATLINTSRGSLVDHEALLEQVSSGRIDAVLDVTEPEPLPVGHPLLGLSNVVVTPHLAGSEGTELRRLAVSAISEIERFCAGSSLAFEVRAEDLARMA